MDIWQITQIGTGLAFIILGILWIIEGIK